MKLLLLISSLAQAKKNKTPCWIIQPCEPYTQERYLIGVGAGETLTQADTAAMGAITRQFSVEVRQLQTATKDLAETTRGGDLISTTNHQNLRTKTEVESAMTLSGVQIASRYESKDLVYSLAIIERETWLQQIDSERLELQNQLQNLMFEAQKKPHHLDRFVLYEQMAPLIQKDELLYKQRQIIDINEAAMPPSYTTQQLQQQQKREHSELYFVPRRIEAESSLDHLITQALGNQGFTCRSTLAKPESLIFFQYSEERSIEGPDSFGFVTYKSTLSIDIRTADRSIEQFEITASTLWVLT